MQLAPSLPLDRRWTSFQYPHAPCCTIRYELFINV